MNEQDKARADEPPLEHLSTLLDGATGSISEFARQVEAQRRIAADPSHPLDERLEAFDDIVDSEVGDTSLLRARNVERAIGLRQIFIKFEGGNPTGTQKDRIAFAQSRDALRRGFDTVTVATCGNYGVALALAASLSGLRCVVHIPDTYHTRRVQEIQDLGAEIRRVPGDYETAVEASKAMAMKEEAYDANPGGANVAAQVRAYGEISYEIYDELQDAPYAVAVPVSNGTTLAGIYRGFVSLYKRGKTSRMPRMVAGSSFGKNPIVHSFQKKKPICEDLNPSAIRETEVNEPLVNWHSIDGDYALQAVRESHGWAGYASDRELRAYSKLLLENEGLSVLPASTAGLVALAERVGREEFPNDRYVVVLTGRR